MHTKGELLIGDLTMNDGSIAIMAGETRVVVVDYQGDAPPRKRYNAPSPERDANAARIVTCWNSHDALVEALEAIVNLADDRGSVPCDSSAIDAARAALAKARVP